MCSVKLQARHAFEGAGKGGKGGGQKLPFEQKEA